MIESDLSPFKLAVTNADGETATYDLPLGQLVVGRREDCDIVLDHPRTQRQHARLTIDEKGVTVTGVSRRSRIEVNGNPLPIGGEARVVLGDSITLGIYRLELVEIAALPTAPPVVAAGPVEGAQLTRASADAWQFVIQSLDSATRYVIFPDPFPADGLTVGRQEGSDVLLDHPRVERKEALLVFEDGTYRWQALTRRSGTLHNGNPLSPDQPIRLEIGDIIECGPFQLFVEWVGLDRPQPVADEADEAFDDTPMGAAAADSSAAGPASATPATPTASGASGGSSAPPGAFLPDYLRSAPPPPPDFSQVMPPGLDRHSIRYLHYLPTIYHDDVTSRLMGLFEAIMMPVGWNIENFDLFLDPQTAPADFVDWLSEWFRFGFDQSWTETKKRQVLTECHQLYARRGTRYALVRLLEIYTGQQPEIVEDGQPPFTFTVRLPFREREVNRQMVEQIIEANKPAHTNYVLEFDSRLNLDNVWTQLDFE